MDAWLVDAKKGGADTFTGNFNNRQAALEVEGETKDHCPKYSLNYTVMSTFAHPDAAGYDDVFQFNFEEDGLSVGFHEESFYHAFDALVLIAEHAVRALKAGVAQLKMNAVDTESFSNRLRDVAKLHFDLG